MKKQIYAACALVAFLAASGCTRVEADAEMLDLIGKVAESCEVDLAYAFVRECPPFQELREQSRNKPFAVVLGTLSIALNDDDATIRAIASNLLYGEVKDNRHRIHENADRISGAILEKLLSGVADNEDYSARYAVAVTVYTATVLGRHKALFEMLAGHPQPIVRTEGYPKTMTYGRLAVLDLLKNAAEAEDIQTVQAALQAPLEMFDYSPEEQKKVADWLLPYLSSQNTTLAYIAGKILYNKCGSAYIDVVLDTVEQHIVAKGGRLEYPFKYVLDHAHNPAETDIQRFRKNSLMKRIRK